MIDDGPVSPDGVPLVQSPPARRDTIDFWRGFILCTIFVNHIPGNVFEKLTFKNFGFSDSSEAFVFISGLSLSLAYGRRWVAGEGASVTRSLARRAVTLYAVHIGLSVIGVAIFAAGAALAADADIMQVHGRDLVVDDPAAALLGLFSLGHQFGYFNILPLYVLLVAFAPVLLWLARISQPLMLGVSFTIYAVSRLSGLNVPSWPMRGTWFFDPFTWQLLMAVGLAVGLGFCRAWPRYLHRRSLGLAAVVVAASAVCSTDAFSLWPGLNEAVRGWVDVDKTTLGMGRVVHFLALAYLVAGLRLAPAMRGAVWYKPLCLIGAHGRASLVLLSLLAASGQVAVAALGHSALLDVILVSGGLVLLYGFASHRRTRRTAFAPSLAGAGSPR